MEFPYRSSTFFSVDLSCAVQQRSTRVGEQKTLYSSNRGQTSHFNCDVSIARCKTSVPRREYLRQPRSKQTTALPSRVTFPDLSIRVSSSFFRNMRAIFLSQMQTRPLLRDSFIDATVRFKVSFAKILFSLTPRDNFPFRRGKVCWMFVRCGTFHG